MVLIAQPNGTNLPSTILSVAALNDNKMQNLVLPFTVQKTGKLTVLIYRGSNLATSDPITIGYHMALQP